MSTFAMVFFVAIALWGSGVMIVATVDLIRYSRHISKPWGEAIRQRDYSAVEFYAAEAKRTFRNFANPNCWIEVCFGKRGKQLLAGRDLSGDR